MKKLASGFIGLFLIGSFSSCSGAAAEEFDPPAEWGQPDDSDSNENAAEDPMILDLDSMQPHVKSINQCGASCTVEPLTQDAVCPVSISGYAFTPLDEGCTKACGHARDDAFAKLPPGCIINHCNFIGC